MLMRADIAKQAVPFPKQTVADHWLAIWAAYSGSIAFVDKAMLKYRQHSRNQTGILSGVIDKESYRVKRILPLKERLNMLKERIDVQQNLQDFVQARIENRVLGIWKGRKFSPKEAGFEIIMNLLPEKLFQAIISRIRK